MKRNISRHALAASLVLALLGTGCSSLSPGAIKGASIGGVAGAVMSNGSLGGAAVGAIAGGVIGDEIDKHNRRK